MANAVRFIYVSAGHELPDAIDRSKDAIYFYEDGQQIWIGDKLFADHIDPADIDAYLAPYKVKSVEIVGQGTFIASASFDDATGKLTLTRGTPPAVERGIDGDTTEVPLSPGDNFTVVTGTSVADNKIYNTSSKFVLPAQIKDVKIARDGTSNTLILTIESTDGTSKIANLTMFGSAAYTDVSEFATAAQGTKADNAMPADGGTATNAHVTLASDPVAALEAATKQYVDNAVSTLSGAMHFLGVSSTKITDGGREHPKIDGSEVDTDTLNPGDVVLYSPTKDSNYLEFVWAEDATGTGKWVQLGDEASYALKTLKVIAGEGILGGGTLEGDVTLSHGATGSGDTDVIDADDETISAVTGVTLDKFGHVTAVRTSSFDSKIEAYVTESVSEAIADDPTIAHIEDIPSWTVV